MKYGLKQHCIHSIVEVFRKYPQVDSALLYGSRAKGVFRYNSDIDLTLKGQLDLTTLLRIESDLDDLLLPYKIDLSLYEKINNEELLEHIHCVGVVFYEKKLEEVTGGEV